MALTKRGFRIAIDILRMRYPSEREMPICIEFCIDNSPVPFICPCVFEFTIRLAFVMVMFYEQRGYPLCIISKWWRYGVESKSVIYIPSVY